MIFKKMIMILLSLGILATVTTACWSKDELNDLAITVGLGIDKVGDELEVSIQVVDPTQVVAKSSISGGFTPVVLYSAKGESVPDAIGRLATKLPRKVYFAQLWVVIVSEQVAKEIGIFHTLDYLERNHEFRNDFFFAVAKKVSARQLLGIITALDRIPAKNMFQKIKLAKDRWSPVSAKHLDDMINDLLTPGKELVLNSFRVNGNIRAGSTLQNLEKTNVDTNLELYGLAAFKDDKLVGWLTESQSRGYSIVTDQLSQTISVINCSDGPGTVTLHTIRSTTKLKVTKKADGKFKIDVPIRLEADITNSECDFDLTDSRTLKEVEQIFVQKIKYHCDNLINKTRQLNTDVVGFGAAIRRAYPADWKQISKAKDSYYQELEIVVSPEVHIRRIGSIANSPSINNQ